MKKILSVFATFALMASQAPFAQAMPIETSTRLPEKQPAPVFMPDAVGLLNLLTMGAESGELGLDAAFEPVQDDTTPPVITFVPPTLTLFPRRRLRWQRFKWGRSGDSRKFLREADHRASLHRRTEACASINQLSVPMAGLNKEMEV